MDVPYIFLRWVIPFALIALNLVCIYVNIRATRRHNRASAAHEECVDLLGASRDPGRDVHQRLASAFEASLVRPDDSPLLPDPAGRRAAAMAMSASFISTAQRAGLDIIASAPSED